MDSAGLLPPNALPQEIALCDASARMADIPTMARDAWNPTTCPAAHLPWLAWAFSVDEWNQGWTDAQKRSAISASFYVHKHKGTIGAIEVALGSLGYRTTVTEWFKKTPVGAPYTFSIDIEVGDEGITQQTYVDAERIANAAKNVRSHLIGIRAAARTRASLYVGVATVYGEIITVRPIELLPLVTHGKAYIGCAVFMSEKITVLPRA